MKTFRHIIRRLIAVPATMLFLSSPLFTQDTQDLLEMSLEDLMNLEVSVASGKSQKMEEAPSIVSVITKWDFEKYGARDLADILRNVPGFEFGVDVSQLVGTSFRGIWAFEGKIAILMNGVNITEYAFGNFNMIGNIPTMMIDRVEIIRGPGSALYGGYAEVAVINIITNSAATLNNGATLYANGGSMGDAFTGNTCFSIGLANEAQTVEVAAHVGVGYNLISDRDYTPFMSFKHPFFADYTPKTGQTGDESGYRKTMYSVIDGRIKDFKFDFVRNSVTYASQNTWFVRPQVNGINGEDRNTKMLGMSMSYNYQINDKIAIKPLFEYTESNIVTAVVHPNLSHQGTYRTEGTVMDRYMGQLVIDWDNKLLIGGGVMRNGIFAIDKNGYDGLEIGPNPQDTAREHHVLGYYGMAQYTDNFGDLGVTIGARGEFTEWGNAFAPRLGLTYILDNLNFKLLFGSSFRVPTLFQAYTRIWAWDTKDANGNAIDLKPETCNSFEFETGYKFNSNLKAKMNVFYVSITDPLVFQSSYVNSGKINSIGIEAEAELLYPNYGTKVNVSYSKPSGETSKIFLTDDDGGFLGMTPLKVNWFAHYTIGDFTAGTSLTFLSERKGVSKDYALWLWEGDNTKPKPTVTNQTLDALLLLNLNLTYKNLIDNKLDVQATVYNVLDAKYMLIQPYYEYHSPLPAFDRHIVVNFAWHI